VLNYVAAVSVSKTGVVPQGMESLVLPAGSYASFKYPLSGLGQGFGEIFNRLLPSSDLVQVPGPLFERYDEKFDPGNTGSLVEIGVPVKKLR
jgi:AraC family transcriptional regulator